jgi:hypothetical protein
MMIIMHTIARLHAENHSAASQCEKPHRQDWLAALSRPPGLPAQRVP